MSETNLEGAAAALSLASKLVYCEPTDADLEMYAENRLFCGAPFGEEDEAVKEGLRLLDEFCMREGAEEDARSDWFMVFVGAGEPKAPSWAGYYLNTNSQLFGESTLGVRRVYARYGFQLERKNSEPDDNLGIMLGFIAHLAFLELQSGSDAEVLRADQALMLKEYVLPWICSWRWAVAKRAKTDYARGIGELVFGLVRAYASRFEYVFCDDGNPHFAMQ